ncbi:hypothetical protein PO909_017138 [Leuciscus waleckii]
MQCISTVMNASLPLGSVLVPPRAHALPFAEVLFVAYGAHVSNPLIGDGRGPGGATSGRICGVQLFSVFSAAGLAQRQICHLPPSHALSHPANLLIMLRASHPHLLVRGGWHVFLPPAMIRALRGPAVCSYLQELCHLASLLPASSLLPVCLLLAREKEGMLWDLMRTSRLKLRKSE